MIGIIRLGSLPGYYGQQFFLTAVGVVRRLNTWWHLPDILGKVAEEASNHFKGFLFRFRQVIYYTTLKYLGSLVSQFLLGNVIPQGGFHHRGTAGKNLADALYHQGEMADTCLYGRKSGYRAEYRRNYRSDSEKLSTYGTIIVGLWYIGTPNLLEGAYTTTGSVKESEVRYAPLQG